MGVIKRQTIKGSIYSYLGIAIGFIYTYLSTRLLTQEQIGLTGVLVAYSAIYSQFSTLGFIKVVERLFPYFRNKEKNHNGFVFITIVVGLVGFTLSLISFFILKPTFIESNLEKSPLLVKYIWYLIPLIFFRMFTVLLDTYNKMLYDATTGSILTDFIFRIITLTLLGAYFLKWITFSHFVFGYVFSLCFPAMYLVGLLIWRKQFSMKRNLGFIQPSLRKEMINLSFFGLLGSVSSVALTNVDTILVSKYLGLPLTGIYIIGFFFGTIILVPAVALGKISSTFIAEAWKENDMKMISDIYFKSSINQLFAALLFFILMVANLHNIIKILGPEYKEGEWVIILIAFSKLIISSTGSSIQILGTSHKFQVQTYSMVVLVFLSVIFYMIFIPLYGITGAALGSLFSLSIAALLRVFYLKRIMNLFPYRLIHLKCVTIGLAAFAIGKFIPVIDNLYFDLIIRCSVISVVFIGICYLFHISLDLNQLINGSFVQIYDKYMGKHKLKS